MAKGNTLWFPHDYNARADEKTAALLIGSRRGWIRNLQHHYRNAT
jgi:hypothetical protein